MACHTEFPKITRHDLDRLRQLIGVELNVREPFNRYASPDTIRHFAHGIGDDNPLFTNEEYGKSSTWGCMVAPPTFLFSCFGRGAPQGLRGIHSMWGGASFEMYKTVEEDTCILGTVALSALKPKESSFASKTIFQEHTYNFSTDKGQKLAKVREWHLRTERDAARKRGKYAGLEPANYTSEEMHRIYADCEKEEMRGGAKRYWEDIVIGQMLPSVVKGPLRVTDNVAWKIGWGFRPFTFAHKLAVAYYRKHPQAFIPNELGVFDVPERVHWDPDFARRVGVPSSYDFGPQRVSWLGQVVTNWMGDHGFIRNFWGEVRRFNLIGDTHWLQGKVIDKRIDDGQRVVEVELWGYDQRGEKTINGGAVVILSSLIV